MKLTKWSKLSIRSKTSLHGWEDVVIFKRIGKLSENHSFKEFGSAGNEKNRAIGGGWVRGFAGFKNWDDGRLFLSRWESLFGPSFLPWLSFSLWNYSRNISQDNNIVLAVFFTTVCSCERLTTFRNGFCNFRRPLGFIRVIDVAERNDRSGSIIEESGKSMGDIWKRE